MSRPRRVGLVIALNRIAKGLENGMATDGRHLRALFQDFSRIAAADRTA